jgi:hypothetical protein
MANAEDLALDVARVPMVSSEIDPIELARGHLALLALHIAGKRRGSD